MIEERSVMMRCLREIGQKIERGDTSLDAPLAGARRALYTLEDLTHEAQGVSD